MPALPSCTLIGSCKTSAQFFQVELSFYLFAQRDLLPSCFSIPSADSTPTLAFANDGTLSVVLREFLTYANSDFSHIA